MANDLEPFPANLRLDCAVRVQTDRQRPKIELLDESHPLARTQRDGITIDRLLSIYRANGHEIG